MRFLTLHLERYGMFSDTIIRFRPDACLHVVYGVNETGKTSSLAAIRDLLFGFEVRTDYAFLHKYSELSLGATLVGKNGNHLSFKRRKRNNQTLTDAGGVPLTNDTLSPFLGSITRSVFANSFGLSRETLRDGAEEMLKSGGDAGSSLFAAASGLKGLNELRKTLEAEGLAIFDSRRAHNRTFYQALERFEEASGQIGALTLKDRDLQSRRVVIASLQTDLKDIKLRRANDVRRREYLIRQRDLAPLLRSIAADEIELRKWSHLPVMDKVRIEQLRRALDTVAVSAADLLRIQGAERDSLSYLDSLMVDYDLLAVAPVIQSLLGETGNYGRKKADISQVQSELDAFQHGIEDLRIRLGLSQLTDLAAVRPSDILFSRLRAKSEQGKTIAAGLLGNGAATSNEEATLEALRKQEVTHGRVVDPKAHGAMLSRLKPALDQLGEAQRLERLTLLEVVQIPEKARQLSPAIVDLDVFAQIPLPTKETIERFVQLEDTQNTGLSSLRDRVDEKINEIYQAQAQLDKLTQGQFVVSSERIVEARAQRDDSWRPLRSILLQEAVTPALAETATRLLTFELATKSADRLLDEALRDADRLAEHAAACRRVVDEQNSLKRLNQELSTAEKEAECQELAWEQVWKAFAFSAASPRSMSAWLVDVHALLARRSLYQKLSGDFEQLSASIATVRPALNGLALALRIPDSEKMSTSLTFLAVQAELGEQQRQWQSSIQLTTLITSASEGINELRKHRSVLLAAQDTWQSEWSDMLPLVHLAPTTTHDEAVVMLDVWQLVPAALDQFEDRSRRVRGMKRDMELFESRVAILVLQLKVEDIGLGADAIVKTLSERLTSSRQLKTKADVAREQLRNMKQQVSRAEQAEAAARKHLATLSVDLPSIKPISEEVAELEARELVVRTLQQRRDNLLPLSRGEAEATLREALGSFDEDAAVAEIEDLRHKDTQNNQSENVTYAAFTDSERKLAALEAGVGAEVAVQLRKNAEAELNASAQAWIMKKFGQILLAHSVEKHRSQREQPLMKRASQLFATLTDQSFISIEQEYDEKDNLRLVGRRNADLTVCVPFMSEGTRDQLYLALRLAYLEEYADKTEPVPFIGDDIFTSFDEERTAQGLKALAATGRHIQPILFTHHKHVMEIAKSLPGLDVDIIRLEDCKNTAV